MNNNNDNNNSNNNNNNNINNNNNMYWPEFKVLWQSKRKRFYRVKKYPMVFFTSTLNFVMH